MMMMMMKMQNDFHLSVCRQMTCQRYFGLTLFQRRATLFPLVHNGSILAMTMMIMAMLLI